jgi:hypothetical protein
MLDPIYMAFASIHAGRRVSFILTRDSAVVNMTGTGAAPSDETGPGPPVLLFAATFAIR